MKVEMLVKFSVYLRSKIIIHLYRGSVSCSCLSELCVNEQKKFGIQ